MARTKSQPLAPLFPLEATIAPQTEHDPFDDKPQPIQGSSTITGVSNVDPAVISNRTVHCGSAPSATLQPLDISPLPALLALVPSPDITPLAVAAPQMLMTEVVPQMYNGGNVTEIPLVDEDTEQELFSLLGKWYKPESIESLFSSLPSDAVHFSS